ncbi:MAG: T9SS type A sorting domain-containing protein, partial [Bacteroidales bacterium]
TLTSQPFSFNDFSGGSDLYFSFFYQCGGKVSGPETTDTLILEFYSPKDTAWVRAYHLMGGEQMHTFEQIILPVSDTLVTNGFRFRFRNYVSLAMENIPGQDLGKFSNADQWHLDYIRIKPAGSSDELSTINDMTIVKPLLPYFTEYTSVPYDHYVYALAYERTTMPISYRTIFPDREEVISLVRYYSAYDLTDHILLNNLQFDENVEPYGYFNEEEYFTSGYIYEDNDSMAKLEFTAVIEAQALDQELVNDTVKRREIYHDHYAYDDGTAELGLGIAGEYQDLNRIAVRFSMYRGSSNPDTLEAILIYFNKSIDDYTSQSEYRISIRGNKGNKPADDTLYTSRGYFPDYSVRMNEFTRIELERPVIIYDTFFVVIEQLDSYLNIGYDINNNNLNKIFFYTGQNWENSSSLPEGSLMVRASFGNYTLPLTRTKTIESDEGFRIYPNPANDILYFDAQNNAFMSYNVSVYNMTGILLLNTNTDDNFINVGSLKQGMYILRLTSPGNRQIFTTRFIKE